MTDKVSRYCVIGDQSYRTSTGGTVRLIYATRSGKVLPAPIEIAEALAAGRVPAATPSELSRLRNYQLLVPADQDELSAVAARFTDAPDRRHVVLFPTSYCNMGCTYCGQTHVKGTLRGSHRDAVRRRVLGVIEHPGTRSIRLDWFGGEPLMAFAVIRDLAREFSAAATRRDLGWSSTIVTNGSLLDRRKIRSLAAECRVTHAEITIDGLAERHDRHRPLKSGGTSFHRIIDAVTEALADPDTEGLTFGLRTNVDRHNADGVPDLLRFYAEQGFAHRRIRIGLKSVHSWSNDVSDGTVTDFAARELEWMGLMQELGLRFEALPTGPKQAVCPATSRADEFLTPDGQVYSCSEQPLVTSQAGTAVGRLDQDWALADQLRPPGRYDDWTAEVAAGGRSCSACAYYPVCGGACPKLWRDGERPCPSFRQNGRQRLDIVARMNGLSPVPAGAGVSP